MIKLTKAQQPTMKTYSVLAARNQSDVLNSQCDYVDEDIDTIKQAKARAKYVLTDDFQRSGEMSEPFRYAQVCDQDGECLYDFFRKGYNGREIDEETGEIVSE